MRLELLHKGSNHLTFHLHVLPPICPLLVNIDVINSEKVMHWCFSTSDLSCLETQTHPGYLSSTNQGTLRIRSRSVAVLPPLPQVLGDVCSSSFALRLLRFTSATGHLQLLRVRVQLS